MSNNTMPKLLVLEWCQYFREFIVIVLKLLFFLVFIPTCYLDLLLCLLFSSFLITKHWRFLRSFVLLGFGHSSFLLFFLLLLWGLLTEGQVSVLLFVQTFTWIFMVPFPFFCCFLSLYFLGGILELRIWNVGLYRSFTRISVSMWMFFSILVFLLV